LSPLFLTMKKEQFESIKGILKVLDKARFDGLSVTDQYVNVGLLTNFAKTVKELKEELSAPNPVPLPEPQKIVKGKNE